MHQPDMVPQISKPTSLDFLLMGLTALVWASAFIAIKVVVPETGPLWLATWRVIIGFLVMLPYVIWRGIVWPEEKKVWALIAITGIFNVVIPFFLISWAEQSIDAGVAALLMGTGPFFAILGSHYLTTDDRLSFVKVIAVVMGFAGVLMIVGADALRSLGGTTTLGQFAAMGGALSYVVAGLLIRRIDIPPVRLGFLVLGTGILFLLPLSFLFEGLPNLSLSGTALFGLIYLGLFPTGLGQILRFSLIKKVGYALFSLSLNLIPVFGVILGALLLGEAITPHLLIALALVLGGLLVSQLGGRRARSG